MTENSRIATIALFISMAVALHWIESFIPRPAPFLRFGLANIMTLCTLFYFGGPWALFVVVSRVLIGSLISGSLFSPAFFLSLSAGTIACLAMWAMPASLFSPIGISITGAVSHMLTQVILASLLMQHASLLQFMPVFLLVSLLTGMLNGYCVLVVIRTMERRVSQDTSPRT